MLYRIALIVLLLITLPLSLANAKDYSFSWDHNHLNDNVVTYRIYWKTEVQVYNNSRSMDTGYVNEFTINNMAGDLMCFVCTAIDNEGYESDYSNEICSTDTTIRWKIR